MLGGCNDAVSARPLRRRALLAGAVVLALTLMWVLAPSSQARHARRHRHRPSSPVEFGCPILPPKDALNEEIAKAPVNANSAKYIASIGLTAHLHPDFGTNPTYGIPYAVVGPRQPKVPISFTLYGSESDRGPYPVPAHAPIEGGGALTCWLITTAGLESTYGCAPVSR